MKNSKNKKGEPKIGKFETVFDGALFKVREAEVVLPSGHKGKFEVVVRTPSVTVMALDDQNKLLFNREYRPIYKKRVWRLPGGTIEKGESPRTAAQRELREETGFRAKQLKLFHETEMGQTIDWQRHVFLGKELSSSKLEEDEDEDIEIVFLTLPEVMRLIEKGEIKHDLTEYLIYKLAHRQRDMI